MPSSRGSSQPRDGTYDPYIRHWQLGSLPLVPPQEPFLSTPGPKVTSHLQLHLFPPSMLSTQQAGNAALVRGQDAVQLWRGPSLSALVLARPGPGKQGLGPSGSKTPQSPTAPGLVLGLTPAALRDSGLSCIRLQSQR